VTVTVDAGNLVADTSSFTGTASSTLVTVGASDNLLLVVVGNYYNSGSGVPPDAFAYNGVAMTPLEYAAGGSNAVASIFYLPAPPAGSHTLAGTWSTNTTGGGGECCVTAIPISGAAASSIFGTPVTGSSNANNSPLVSPIGGTAGSLYIAAAFNGVPTTAGSGAGQTDIFAQNAMATYLSFNVGIMAGSGSGDFTWAGSGSGVGAFWSAIGVNINAASGAPPSGMFLMFP
jgi:hypothetical protein